MKIHQIAKQKFLKQQSKSSTNSQVGY